MDKAIMFFVPLLVGISTYKNDVESLIDKKIFLEQLKDPRAVFWCNNDCLFSEKNTVKVYISNAKLEKLLHQNTAQGSSFPIAILF